MGVAKTLLERVFPSLRDSVRKTFDELSNQRAQIEQRLQQVRDGKDEILSLYQEGIAALKRYELHPNLCKDGKKNQHLIDIYYAESSMDNFRRNCVAQLDKISLKMDDLKRDFHFKFPALINISTVAPQPTHLFEQLAQAESKLQRDVVEGIEPLLLSVLFAVGEDLKALHSQLDKCKVTSKVDSLFLIGLKTKQSTHARLLMEIVEHMRQAEAAQSEVLRVKEAICVHLFQARQHLQPARLLKGITTLKDMKILKDNLESQDKDLQYLKKPAQVPNAYELALVEMIRRKDFRSVLDADVATLRAFIKTEQERRREFSKNVHTYLPSQFCPQLRDQVPDLLLEGAASEYSFADVRDAVPGYEPIESPFKSRQTQSTNHREQEKG